MKRRMNTWRLCFPAIALVIVSILPGCSDRLVNDSGAANFRIPLSAELVASKVMAAADLFRLTVTDPETDSLIAEISLIQHQAVLEGTVEDLPAGRPLDFLVEAMESAAETVIYQGSATTIVEANTTTTLHIPLYPVVPLQRFKPRFAQLLSDSSFVLDTWVENVDSLYGISFRILWPSGFSLTVDSTKAGDDVSSPGVIFFSQPVGDSIYTFSITQTGAGATLVDATGRAHLARAFCTVRNFTAAQPGRIQIEVEPTGLTGVDSTVIPLGSVYADDFTLDLGASVQ